MHKTWNMNYWQKVMKFCDQSRNFTNFALKYIRFVLFVLTLRNVLSVKKVRIFLTILVMENREWS